MVDLKEKLKEFNKRSEFDEIVAPYRDELWDIVYRLCHDEQNTDDIIQGALLKAYKNWGALKKEDSRFYWLRTIVTNATNDYFRRKTNERKIVVKIPVDVVESIIENGNEEVVEEIRDEKILEALSTLNEGTRVVAYLRFICDFSYLQLMDATGVSYGAITERVRRGKKKLQEELKDYNSNKKVGGVI